MGQKSRAAEHKLKPYEDAVKRLGEHYLLGPVAQKIGFMVVSRWGGLQRKGLPPVDYCQIEGHYHRVFFNDALKLPPEQWLGVFSLITLIFATGGVRQLSVSDSPSPLSELSAQLAALYWWHHIRVGELPEQVVVPADVLSWGRLPLAQIAARLQIEQPQDVMDGGWTLCRSGAALMLPDPRPPALRKVQPTYQQPVDHEGIFAQSLVDNARRALQLQHDTNQPGRPGGDPNSVANRAKRWLINHYPLLGALLTGFELVEDPGVCARLHIGIAAIQVGTGEIYLNPLRQLGLEQCKFVLAHEVLHAGLSHASRRQGRDPFLWNVACDFVINDWLVGMNLGIAPEGGLLFDEELRGLSAEDIYLKLAADLRVRRRLSTFRGDDVDLLDAQPGRFFTDREEFCRRALAQGLDYHQCSGRGLLPAGLVEAIRVLNQPAIPWQAKLAEWIQERFPLPQRQRSYARPSRRQSATPDIPRPRYIEVEDDRGTRTYGVILDTSGSMDREILGKALGAIVAYSQAQGVKQVRLVYCDAHPYDEGYVSVDTLAARVRVRGRGGTVLQAAVNLLEGQKDFAKDCPILIITDGYCEDDLRVAHDHAFLVSPGKGLPFVTRKPVFQMQ